MVRESKENMKTKKKDRENHRRMADRSKVGEILADWRIGGLANFGKWRDFQMLKSALNSTEALYIHSCSFTLAVTTWYMCLMFSKSGQNFA